MRFSPKKMQLTRSLLHSVSWETYLDQINKTTETAFATPNVKMHPFLSCFLAVAVFCWQER